MMRRALAAAFVALALSACNPKVESTATATPSPTATPTGIALKISGHGTTKRPLRIIQQAGNRVEYDLLAHSFQSIGAQGSALVNFADVHVTFHGKTGSTLIADAPHATLDQVKNTIVMDGGVHAHNEAGMSLRCDRLLYDHATRMVFGTGHVMITNATGFNATGNRFQSDISLTHTRMQ